MTAPVATQMVARLPFLRARWAVVRASEPIIAIAIALLVGAIVIALIGESPIVAYRTLFQYSVGSLPALAQSLQVAMPMILVGIGMGLAFKTGVINIGGEGQMIFGALAAAILGHALGDLPLFLLLPLIIVAGCLAGAGWALLSGWWYVSFNVPVVITSLLLNYIAVLFGTYLVTYPLRDTSGGSNVAKSVAVAPSLTSEPLIAGSTLNYYALALIIVPLVLIFFLGRTVTGYRMRMAGLNPNFAEYGGISKRGMALGIMLLSGAVCGVAGTLYVVGDTHRYIDGSINLPIIAWLGLVASMLALYHPGYTILTGLFIGALQVGGTGLQLETSVPLQLVSIIQATLILTISARIALGAWARRALKVGS